MDVGPPGTGKTMLMRAAQVAWTGQGYRVAGAATAAVAAQNLAAESGIASRTVADHGVATTADITRSDVGAEHTASGPNHGFDVTRGGIVAGSYNVCAYGINAPGTPGGNTLLGCRNIMLT